MQSCWKGLAGHRSVRDKIELSHSFLLNVANFLEYMKLAIPQMLRGMGAIQKCQKGKPPCDTLFWRPLKTKKKVCLKYFYNGPFQNVNLKLDRSQHRLMAAKGMDF